MPNVAKSERTLRRPLSPLPNRQSVNALAKALQSFGSDGLGLSAGAALAVANAIAQPVAARKQLEYPIEQRVAGGSLLTLSTTVWAQAIMPMPTNARLSPDNVYPVSGLKSAPLLEEPSADPSGLPERILHVDSRQQLIDALDYESTYLLDHNDYRESIGLEGVREALLVSVLRVEHGDGDPNAYVLVADDGSSRMSSCHELLHQQLETTTYRFAEDPDALRKAVAKVVDLATTDRDDLDDEDFDRMHALELPALVVVGFRADDHDTDNDIARAIAYKVGHTHVEPPEAWSEGAQLDKKLALALDECVRRGKAAPGYARYLAGTMAPEDSAKAGFGREWDTRAVSLLSFFSASTNTQAINAGIRGLYGRKVNPDKTDRIELAVEAAIRPYRRAIAHRAVETSRRSLNDLMSMPEFKSIDAEWAGLANGDTDKLRDRALKEVAKSRPGASAHTLMLMGAYWMIRHQQLRPTSGGQHEDKRTIPQLLHSMIATKRGVWQLWQSVANGRAGAQPIRVRVDGKPALGPTHKFIAVDDAWIRKKWPPKDLRNPEPTPPEVTPEGQLRIRREDFLDALETAGQVLTSFSSIRDGTGAVLAERIGLPETYTSDAIKRMDAMEKSLNRYEFIFTNTASHSAGAAEASDEG